MPEKNSKLVYSTNFEIKQKIENEKKSSHTNQFEDTPPANQTIKISLEKKGRKGKIVTLILGLQHARGTLASLARELKQYCGSGGTVKEQVIEIQGDKRKQVEKKLIALGYHVRVL